MNHSEKAHAMRALEEEIIAKNITPELAFQEMRQMTLVMGEGNLDADIFFIGEAPGAKENASGRPFMGVAGKFLDEMLQKAKLDRGDVYITNIVKYQPPKNRDPKPAEIEESWPYLAKQIEIVKPKVLITLGRISMKHFLPEAVIGQVHGQTHLVEIDGQEFTLITLYHPSAATYKRELRPVLIEDFLKVPEIIKAI